VYVVAAPTIDPLSDPTSHPAAGWSSTSVTFDRGPRASARTIGEVDGLEHVCLSRSLRDNFIVKEYVPQPQILDRASVFISHGGMGGISEAMVSNVRCPSPLP
jgi:hypothetical protein